MSHGISKKKKPFILTGFYNLIILISIEKKKKKKTWFNKIFSLVYKAAYIQFPLC